jgi:uncharacterized membrane protein YfcA
VDLTAIVGLAPETLALLMAVALCAGVIDGIAGGGGMLNVPSLMLAGLDPVSAVATNKLQGTFGVASAARSFARARLIDWRAMRLPFWFAVAGSMLGAVAAQIIPSDFLRLVVPFLLIALALFVATSRKLSDDAAHQRVSAVAFAAAFSAPIGFYDGFFGPGGGTFYFIALVTLLGQGVTRAAGNAKLLNLASNAGSLAVYAASGIIWWWVGVALGLCSYAGAGIGARLAMKKGAALIKPLVVIVAIALALRLLAAPDHPFGAWLRSLF